MQHGSFEFYGALGLEPRLSVDPDNLKKRFFEQSRRWHPDRFSRASAEEQRRALDTTALINDAFRTLRDPFARAEYFFKESGIELPKEVSPGILEEFFEWNMALQELKSGDESVRPQLVEAQQRYQKLREQSGEQIGTFFELYDQLGESDRRTTDLVNVMGDLINVRRYISNFLREVDKELNVHVSD
jgi:molecular chaperone HscB